MDDFDSQLANHPHAHLSYLWEGDVLPPPLADPDEPMRVLPSHLNKLELGKSSSSCKVAYTTRLHRQAALQQFWCASFEEAQVYENIAANPNVIAFREQLTRTPYVNLAGESTHTLWDCNALLKTGATLLVSVKYDEKANRKSYLQEVANIAPQCSADVADRVQVLSRFSFHPAARECAKAIHMARRGWDPEADRIVLEAANDLGSRFTFSGLIDASRLGDARRGYRAAVRLIGDGDIGKHKLDLFTPNTQLWSNAS